MKRLSLQQYLVFCFALVGAVPTIFLGLTQIIQPQTMHGQAAYITLSWCGFALLLAAVFGAFLSERVLSPIRRLREGILAASHANFTHCLDPNGAFPREIQDVNNSFNEMVALLHGSWSSLERKVEERTQELSDLNVQLEKQKVELEAIFSCMADGVIVTDATGEILKMNQAARKLLGTGPVEDSSYKSYARIYNLYRPDGKPFPFHELPLSRAIIEGKASTNVPVLLAPKNGERHDLLVSAAPLGNQEGKIEYAVAVFTDVTALTEAEREIRHKNEVLEVRNQQIQDASRAKGQFLANMSHELRTPLNAIIGFAKMLKRQRAGDLSAKQERYASNIASSGEHLLELVNDILDLSKIDAAKLSLDLENVDAQALIEDVLEVIRPLVNKKQIKLVAEIESDMPEIAADKKRLRQILFNLLSNAVKFTHSGGTVRVEVRKDYKSGHLYLAVHDTGIGIPETELKNIFDEFHQIENSFSREQQGTGLGLALTQKLVKLHSGKLEVVSEVGKGSTFTVLLPLQPKPIYVLLMEDHAEVAELFSQKLHEDGFEVLTVDNSTEGIRRARNQHPDLIFLEMSMEGDKSGIEILKALRSDAATANIPVIVMTAGDPLGSQEIKSFIQSTVRQGDFTFQRLLANVHRVMKISA